MTSYGQNPFVGYNVRYLGDEVLEIFKGDYAGTFEVLHVNQAVIPSLNEKSSHIFRVASEDPEKCVTSLDCGVSGGLPYSVFGTYEGRLGIFNTKLDLPFSFSEVRNIWTSPNKGRILFSKLNLIDAGLVFAAYENDDHDVLQIIDMIRGKGMMNAVPFQKYHTVEYLLDGTWIWHHPALLAVSTNHALRILDIRCPKESPEALFTSPPPVHLTANRLRSEMFCGVAGDEIHFFDVRNLWGPICRTPVIKEVGPGARVDTLKWHPRNPLELLYSSRDRPYIGRFTLDPGDGRDIHPMTGDVELEDIEIISMARVWDLHCLDHKFVAKMQERRKESYHDYCGPIYLRSYEEQHTRARSDDTQRLPQILNPPRHRRIQADDDHPSGELRGCDVSSDSDDYESGLNYEKQEEQHYDEDETFEPNISDVNLPPVTFSVSPEESDGELEKENDSILLLEDGCLDRPNSPEVMAKRSSVVTVIEGSRNPYLHRNYKKYQEIDASTSIYEQTYAPPDPNAPDDPVVFMTSDASDTPIITKHRPGSGVVRSDSNNLPIDPDSLKCTAFDLKAATREIPMDPTDMSDMAELISGIIGGDSLTTDRIQAFVAAANSHFAAATSGECTLSIGKDFQYVYKLNVTPLSFDIAPLGFSGVTILSGDSCNRIGFVSALQSEEEVPAPQLYAETIRQLNIRELYESIKRPMWEQFVDRLSAGLQDFPHNSPYATILSRFALTDEETSWWFIWASGSANYYEYAVAHPAIKKTILGWHHHVYLKQRERQRQKAQAASSNNLTTPTTSEKSISTFDVLNQKDGSSPRGSCLKKSAISSKSSSSESKSDPCIVSSSKPEAASSSRSSEIVTFNSTNETVSSQSSDTVSFKPNTETSSSRSSDLITFTASYENVSSLPVHRGDITSRTILKKNTLPSTTMQECKSQRNRFGPKSKVPPKKPHPVVSKSWTPTEPTPLLMQKGVHRREYHLPVNKHFQSKAPLMKAFDFAMKGFPGLLQLALDDKEKKIENLQDSDIDILVNAKRYMSENRERMLIPFMLTRSDVTIDSLGNTEEMSDFFELMLGCLLHGKFLTVLYAAEEMLVRFGPPEKSNKIDWYPSQYMMKVVMIVRRMAKLETKYKNATSRTMMMDDWVSVLNEFVDQHLAVGQCCEPVIRPIILFLKAAMTGSFQPEDVTDEIVFDEDIPLPYRILWIVTTCRTDIMYDKLLALFELTKGLDRLIYVGLGRHPDSLSVLVDYLHETQDWQVVSHLLASARIFEERCKYFTVLHELTKRPETLQEKQTVMCFGDDLKFKLEECDEIDTEVLADICLDSKWQIYRVCQYMANKGRLPPMHHMDEIFHHKHLPQFVSTSTLLAVCRMAIVRYLYFLSATDFYLFRFQLIDLLGCEGLKSVGTTVMRFEMRCQFCGSTRSRSEKVKSLTDPEKQRKDEALRDLTEKRRDKRKKQKQEGRYDSDMDISIREDDFNGSMGGPPSEIRSLPSTACPQCRKGWIRCVICRRSDRIIFLGISSGDEIDLHFSVCKFCHHGGHTRHLNEWFRKEKVCAVHSCNCRCSRVPMKETVNRWMEEDKGFHPERAYKF